MSSYYVWLYATNLCELVHSRCVVNIVLSNIKTGSGVADPKQNNVLDLTYSCRHPTEFTVNGCCCCVSGLVFTFWLNVNSMKQYVYFRSFQTPDHQFEKKEIAIIVPVNYCYQKCVCLRDREKQKDSLLFDKRPWAVI